MVNLHGALMKTQNQIALMMRHCQVQQRQHHASKADSHASKAVCRDQVGTYQAASKDLGCAPAVLEVEEAAVGMRKERPGVCFGGGAMNTCACFAGGAGGGVGRCFAFTGPFGGS